MKNEVLTLGVLVIATWLVFIFWELREKKKEVMKKKEDYLGKWILRWGDLLPEKITQHSWESIGLTIKCCEYLERKGLLFDSMDEAKKCAEKAVDLIKRIKEHK